MSEGLRNNADQVTRQFNYEDSHDSSGKGLFRSNRLSPQCWTVIYFLAPLFVILLLIGGGFIAVWSHYFCGNDSSVAAGDPYHLSVLDAENVEMDLLERYANAQGGLEALQQLKRLTLQGSIFESGQQYVFEGKKERGGFSQFTLTDRKSGISLWLEQGRLRSSDVTVPVNSKLLPMVSLVGEFFDPFADLIIMNKGRIIQVDEIDWRGVPAFRVCFDRPDHGMKTDVYLSRADLLALERVDVLLDGSEHTYRYSNYQYVNGFRFPFTVYVDGGGDQLRLIHFSRIDADSSVI